MIDLDELERLAKAATPGPWHKQGFDVYAWQGKRRQFVARTAPVVVSNRDFMSRNMNDPAYIVAACNAVPELIARVRELQAKIANLKEIRLLVEQEMEAEKC